MTRTPDLHGQESTRLLARPRVIGRVLLRQCLVFLVLLVPPLLCALVEQEWSLSLALAAPTAVIALGFGISKYSPIPEDLRREEAVLALVLIFILSCVLTFPSFRVLGFSTADAIFEATSAITTTGLSVADNTGSWPVSAHFLRAWMQWCGGLVIAIAGLALLPDRGPALRILGTVGMEDDRSLLSSTREKARRLLAAYLALTTVGIVGAVVLIPGYWEGAVLALAAVSTGGFTPRPDSLASYSLAAQTFVILLSALGSVSLLFYVIFLKKGLFSAWRSAIVQPAVLTVGVLVVVSAIVTIVLRTPPPEELNDRANPDVSERSIDSRFLGRTCDKHSADYAVVDRGNDDWRTSRLYRWWTENRPRAYPFEVDRFDNAADDDTGSCFDLCNCRRRTRLDGQDCVRRGAVANLPYCHVRVVDCLCNCRLPAAACIVRRCVRAFHGWSIVWCCRVRAIHATQVADEHGHAAGQGGVFRFAPARCTANLVPMELTSCM